MRKNDKKQRRSLLFSTAIVVTGCLVTGIYVNQTMNQAEDYKVDLSQLNGAEEEDSKSEFISDAGAARANGSDVVNPHTDDNKSKTKATDDDTKGGIIKDDTAQDDTTQDNTTKNNTTENGTTDSSEISKTTTETTINRDKSVETLSFSSQDGMTWPVMGDVILNYSMDSTVFFSTLEQYKYNPAIFIGASEGDNVSSCAKGQVTKIGRDDEIGTYVIMNLGNGYEVTCGQLAELQVKEGDVVARGQVIGTVAKTTKYYALEGDHVYLKITKDGEPVNPLDLLQ